MRIKKEGRVPVEEIGIVQVFESLGRLADDVRNDALFEALTVLNALLAREVLQDAQERALDHEGRDDPQRASHIEAAIARQNVFVVT